MNSKVTYHQQVSYCGKPRCRKCREGTGHGPYWYAYQTVDGKTSRTYIGKHLPPEVQAEMMSGVEPPSVQATEREQSTIRIYVLGQFRLERKNARDPLEWQTVTEAAWQHQRVRSLLGCLVSSEGRKLGREQIMDALWPELDVETGGSRLDRAVYSLRQVFEPTRGKLATSPLVLTEREMVVLAPHPLIWIDADVFEMLLAKARASADLGERERLLEEAATLYGGEFLPEERKNEWTRARRETLVRSWIGLLLDLADLYIAREAYVKAIEPLDKLLGVDPTNEAAVQRLMLALGKQDRRGEALRAYKKLAAALQQEYRIAPLPETRALYESLRSSGAAAKEAKEALIAGGATAMGSGQARGDATRASIPLGGAREAAVQIGRPHQAPLVGREREIETLRTLVTTTENLAKFRIAAQKRMVVTSYDAQRRPQCMLLLGDVGIGKTRLAEEVSRDARKRGWTVTWSRVYAQEGSIPYRMWTEILNMAMERSAWQRQEISKRPIVFQPLTALLPDLQRHLPQVSFTSAQSPEQEQLRLWEAVHALLVLVSESTPLLIALDDLQWADNSSCELLAYLARRIYGLPIVIVGTCRDNELAANHPLRPMLTDLQRENAVETVALEPLNDEQITSLVSYIPHVPEPLVEHIRSRAAGNPFFAEELARSLEDRANRAAWEGGSTQEPDVNDLPDTITAVLDLRMNRLSTECQRLLSKAAVLGGSFAFHVINAMEASTPGSDEDVVLELLEEGLRSGMLTEEGIGTRITYHFWHPLLVNHLYEKLSAARRALLHRRAAEVLRKVYQGKEEEHAAEILHHLLHGGATADKIAQYAEMAGDYAYTLSDNRAAEEHYRVALEHLEGLEEDWQRHAYILERLGECIRIRGKFEEARHFFEQVLEIRQQHLSAASPDYLKEVQLQALLWCEIGLTWYNRGNIAKAQECYHHSEQVLQEAKVVDGPAWAYLRYQQSYVKWREGNYEEARRIAHEVLDLFEDVVDIEKDRKDIYRLTRTGRVLAGDPISLGRTHMLLGLIANGAGQSNIALSHFNTALNLYEQNSYLREISIVCCNIGDIHLRRAELNLAQPFFHRSQRIAEEISDLPSVFIALANLGILSMRNGNLFEAERRFKDGILLTERVNDSVYTSYLNTYLALSLQEQAKLAEANLSLSRALKIAHSMRIDPCIGFSLVTLGNMRVVQALMIDIEQQNSNKSRPILQRAKKSLQRALSIKGIEAETRTEGQLILAYTQSLLGETEEALRLAIQTLEDARKFELTWLVARAQRVVGGILEAVGERGQADGYFEQALRAFRKSEMKLEYARTLREYGEVLVRRGEHGRGRGVDLLGEAREKFGECGAVLDVRLVERVLESTMGAISQRAQ